MIIFELICNDNHRFEGWFASGDDFDRQRANGLLSCPTCANAQIEKLPSAKIKKHEPVQAVKAPTSSDAAAQAFTQFVDAVFKNSEDVGKQFAEEARRIHYEEAPQRNIRGLATAEENAELREEGIPVVALPIPPRDKLN